MNYPTFETKYGQLGAAQAAPDADPMAPIQAPEVNPWSQIQQQPQENPWLQKLDPWAKEAENEQIALAKTGAKV